MNNPQSYNNNKALQSKASENNVDGRRKSILSLNSSSLSSTSLNQSSQESSVTPSLCSLNVGRNGITKNTKFLLPYLFGDNDGPELCTKQDLHELFENIKQVEKSSLGYCYYYNNASSGNNNNNLMGNNSQVCFQRGSSLSNVNNSVSNVYDSVNSVLYNHIDTLNNGEINNNNNYLNTRRKFTPASINSSLSSNNIADDYYTDEYICDKKCDLIRKHFEKHLKPNLSGYELCKLLNIYLSLLFQTPLSMVLLHDQFNDELIGSFPTKGTWENYIPINITNRWLDYKTTCKHNTHICEHDKYKFSNKSRCDSKNGKDGIKSGAGDERGYFNISNRRATFPPQTIGGSKIRYKSRFVEFMRNSDPIEKKSKNKHDLLGGEFEKKEPEQDEYDLIRVSMSTIKKESNDKSFLKQIISQGQKQNFYYFNYTKSICDYIIRNNYEDKKSSNSGIVNGTIFGIGTDNTNVILKCGKKHRNINIIKDDKNNCVDNIFGLYFYNKLREIEQLPCDIAKSTRCPKCDSVYGKTALLHDGSGNTCANTMITGKDDRSGEILASNSILVGAGLGNRGEKNESSSTKELLYDINNDNTIANIGDYPVILVSAPSVSNDNVTIHRCCICESNRRHKSGSGNATCGERSKLLSISTKGVASGVLGSDFSDTDVNMDNRMDILYQRYSNYKIPVITCPIFDIRSDTVNSNRLVGIIICLQPQNPNILLLRNLILELQSLICLFIECKRLSYNTAQLQIYNELHRWVFKPLTSQRKYLLGDRCEWSLSIDVISRICHFINSFTPVQYYLVYIKRTSSEYICIYGPKRYIGYTVSKIENNVICRIIKSKKVIIMNDFQNIHLFLGKNDERDGKYKMFNSAFLPVYVRNEGVCIILQLVNRLDISGSGRFMGGNINIDMNNGNVELNLNSERGCFNKFSYLTSNKESSNTNNSVSNSTGGNSRATCSNKSSISSFNNSFSYNRNTSGGSVNYYMNEINRCNNVENMSLEEEKTGMRVVGNENRFKIKDFTILDSHIYKTILRHFLEEFQQEILLLNMHLYYKTLRNFDNNGVDSSSHRFHKFLKSNFGIVVSQDHEMIHISGDSDESSSIIGEIGNSNADIDDTILCKNHTGIFNYGQGYENQQSLNENSSEMITKKDGIESRSIKNMDENNAKGGGYLESESSNCDSGKKNDTRSLDNICVKSRSKKSNSNDSLSSVGSDLSGNTNLNVSIGEREKQLPGSGTQGKRTIISRLKREIEFYLKEKERRILDSKLSMYRELELPLWVHNWSVHKRFLLDLFYYFGFLKKWNWDERSLTFLFDIIHDSYNKEVPYHNIFHALQVVQVCYIILRRFGVMLVLSDIQKFTLLFAALCHDIDHPGVNNMFLKECNSKLAIKYNDYSILENHHCSFMFNLLDYNVGNIDIRQNFNREEKIEFRRLFIRSVLSTDMTNHNRLMSILKDHVSNATYENNLGGGTAGIGDVDKGGRNPAVCDDLGPSIYESDELNMNIFGENIDDNSIISVIDKELLVESLLHASDISNPIVPFELSKKWASLIQEEFTLQAELEKQYSIPVTPFMDAMDKMGRIEAQIGFLEYAVIPQWKILSRIIPRGNMFLRQAEINRELWFEERLKLVNSKSDGNSSETNLFDFTLNNLKTLTISGGEVLREKITSLDEEINAKISSFKCDKYKLNGQNSSGNNKISGKPDHKRLLLVLLIDLECDWCTNFHHYC